MADTTPETRSATIVARDLRRRGTIPQRTLDTLERLDGVTTTIARLRAEHDDTATQLLHDHLDGKKISADRLTEIAVAQIVVTSNAGQHAERRAHHDLLNAVRADSPAIIESLRPQFDEAAETIRDAATVLGDVDLDDLAAITTKGGDAAEHWKKASAADKTITTILTTIQQLRFTRAYPGDNDPRQALLAIADLDLAGYQKVGRDSTPWQLHHLGTLSLASADEFDARVTSIESQWSTDDRNPATRVPAGVGQLPASHYSAAGAL